MIRQRRHPNTKYLVGEYGVHLARSDPILELINTHSTGINPRWVKIAVGDAMANRVLRGDAVAIALGVWQTGTIAMTGKRLSATPSGT